MKTKLLFSMICLFVSTITMVFGQNSLNSVDSLGMKQGLWTEYRIPIQFLKGKVGIEIPEVEGEYYFLTEKYHRKYFPIVKSTGEYVNNVKEGLWTEYYSNDIIRSEVEYRNGVPYGDCKLYWNNGNIKLELSIDERTTYNVNILKMDGTIYSHDTVFKRDLIKSIYEN